MPPKTLVKKKYGKFKHVDPIVNIINTFPSADTKELSNINNNTRSTVDFGKNTSSTYSCAGQNSVSDKINHSSDCTTSYPID